MKSFNAILTIGSILAFVGCTSSAPIPEPQGAPRIETVVEYVTEVQVIGVTITVWVPPGGATTTEADPTTTEADPTTTSSSKKSSIEEPTSTTTTTSFTSTEETTSTTSTTEETTSTTSTTEETTSTTSTTEETTSTTSTSTTTPPPTTTKTTTPVVLTTSTPDPTPTPEPTPTPDPTTPKPMPSSTPLPTTGGTNGWDGVATFYDTGVGSCGVSSDGSELVVALSHEIMSPLNFGNPNNNQLCGGYIVCSYNGGPEVKIRILDTCPGCDKNHVDLSRGAFAALGGAEADGKIPVHCAYA